MKSITKLIIASFTIAFIVGCAHFPVAYHSVAIPASVSSDQVLEIASDAGRTVGLPPVTKLDKANGLIEFGAFNQPVIGYTAQVRVRTDHQAEVTVKRGSTYISQDVNAMAQRFQAEFEAQLNAKK